MASSSSLVKILDELAEQNDAKQLSLFFQSYRYQWATPEQLIEAIEQLPSSDKKILLVDQWLREQFHRDFSGQPLVFQKAGEILPSGVDYVQQAGEAPASAVPPVDEEEDVAHLQLEAVSQWSSKNVANSLTQFIHQVYRTLPVEELLLAEPRGKSVAKYLARHFSALSTWSATLVEEHGVEMVKKLLKIAQQLYKMANYQCLFGIVAGLNSPAVRQLKEMWAALPTKYAAQFQRYEAMMNPSHDFKAYVAATQGLSSEQPSFPYLVYLSRSLMRITERALLVNKDLKMDTVKRVGEMIDSVKQSQQIAYSCDSDPQIATYFRQLVSLLPDVDESEESSLESFEGLLVDRDSVEEEPEVASPKAPAPLQPEPEPEPEPEPVVEADAHVKKLLLDVGLPEYEAPFARNSVRFSDLPTLQDGDLSKLGVTKLGHRKRILRAIKSTEEAEEEKVEDGEEENTPMPAAMGLLVSPRARSVPDDQLSNVTVFIKAKMHDVVRVVKAPRSISVRQLEKAVRAEFETDRGLILNFKDWEGDFISLKSRIDLEYAMMHSNGNALSIYVATK